VEIYQRSFRRARSARRLAWIAAAPVLLLQLLAGPAGAQVVPYVPTPLDVVERMLTMARVGMNDYLIDLGSGDGRVVRESARRIGNRGMGVDHDPELVARSTELARRDGVGDKVSFVQQDLFETDIEPATVVTMYLLPAVNLKLRPKLLAALKPGTRVVSHDFDMGDWTPDEAAEMYSKLKYGETGGNSKVFLWIVPADMAGRWQWRMQIAGQNLDYDLRVTQRYQKLEGLVRVNGEVKKLENITLRGDAIAFTIVGEVKGSTVHQRFDARVSGEAMTGSVALSGPRMHGAADFSAARSERGLRPDRQTSASEKAAVAAVQTR